MDERIPVLGEAPPTEKVRLGRRLGRAFLDAVVRAPRPLVKAFLLSLSVLSRNVLSKRNQQRIGNVFVGRKWPEIEFGPQRILLGRETEVRLVPHLGEFDEQALLMRSIDYERAMFGWLEQKADDYDLIIEIGANVGIYTVFFDALRRKRLARDPRHRQTIVSFEPASEAYRRLRRNLDVNNAEASVFQAAVGIEAGFQTFHEPVGHLTNGSFVRSFAAHFSADLKETSVLVVAARDLDRWISTSSRALIKIDVEGYEPPLIEALGPLLEKYHPDLLIEVMPSTEGPLQESAALSGYDRFLVTGDGLKPEQRFYFSQTYFDWFLTRKGEIRPRESD